MSFVNFNIPQPTLPKGKNKTNFRLVEVSKYQDNINKLAQWLTDIVEHGDIVSDLIDVKINVHSPKRYLRDDIQHRQNVVRVSFGDSKDLPIGKLPDFFSEHMLSLAEDDETFEDGFIKNILWVSRGNSSNINIGVAISVQEDKNSLPDKLRDGIEVFRFRVAGVTFEGRQKKLELLHGAFSNDFSKLDIHITRDKKNKYDKNAIAIYHVGKSFDGAGQLGFIPKEDAKRISKLIDEGWRYEARVDRIGRMDKNSSWGMGVTLQLYPSKIKEDSSSKIINLEKV